MAGAKIRQIELTHPIYEKLADPTNYASRDRSAERPPRRRLGWSEKDEPPKRR